MNLVRNSSSFSAPGASGNVLLSDGSGGVVVGFYPLSVHPTTGDISQPFVPQAFATAISCFVSPTGNDSTGTRGNPALPFLTVSAAVAAATQPGDCVQILPGTYTENNGFSLDDPTGAANPGGINLVGTSGNQDDAIIQSTRNLNGSGNGSIIKPGNNSYLASLTVHANNGSTSVFQAPVGCAIARGEAQYVGVVCYNLKLIGGTDGFYNVNATCQFDTYNCTVNARWDTANTGNSNVRHFNPTFTTTGNWPGSNAGRNVVNAAGTVVVVGGSLTATGGTTQNTNVSLSGYGLVQLIGVTSIVSGTNAYDVYYSDPGLPPNVSQSGSTGSGAGGAMTVHNGIVPALAPVGVILPTGLVIGGDIISSNGRFLNTVYANGISVSNGTFTPFMVGGTQPGNVNLGFGGTGGFFSLNDGSGSSTVPGTLSMDGGVLDFPLIVNPAYTALADLEALIGGGVLLSGAMGYGSDICNQLPTPEPSGMGTGCWVQFNGTINAWCYLGTTTPATN